MACGRRRPASCNGSRSSCPRAVCTFTASRTGSPVCTQSGVMRCERCASYVAITRLTPTYSFPSAAGQSAPSASIASSSGSGKPLTCRSRSTRTCFAMPAGSSWPMMATTRGPCSTTLGTRTSSTPSGTPKWRPTSSRTFGGTEPVLGLGSGRHGGCWFCRPLDHSNRAASLRFQRCRQVLDHRLKLLVRQVLERIAVVDLVLARNQQCQDLQVRGRLCSAHTFNRLRTAVPEVSEQGRNKLADQVFRLGFDHVEIETGRP